MEGSESLSDKLKALGVRTASSQPEAKPDTRARYDISDVVQGSDIETPFGPTFVVETDFPFEAIQGKGLLSHALSLDAMGQWSGYPDLSSQPIERFVFLDTETSGLSGGTGTFIFLVGLGYWHPSGFHLVQLFLRDPAQEPGLLAGLSHFISADQTIVTFNGKSFDIPLLNGRHVMNGFTSPFRDMQHIDLLPLARRLWRNRLPSRALKDLETEILGLARTEQEVPGWMIPELYYEYLRTGDARPLGGVIYHNAQDILSLGLLFNYSADLLAHPLQVSPQQGLDLIAIARLYEEFNRWDVAVELYENGLSQGLPLPFFLDTLRRYANLYRKQQRFDDALQLWMKTAEYHQVDACVEIAKHFEHRQKDPVQALHWVEIAQQYLQEMPASPQRSDLRKDLDHRARRLLQKINPSPHTT